MRAYWKKFPDEWGNGGTGKQGAKGGGGVSVHVPPLFTSVYTLDIFCPTKCSPYDMFLFMRGRKGEGFFFRPRSTYVAVLPALERERSSSLIKYSKISTRGKIFLFPFFFSTHFISPKINKDLSTLTSITET